LTKIPTIYTPNLKLRELEKEDLDAIYRIRSNKNIFKFVIWGPINFQETKKMLTKQIAFQNDTSRKVYVFAVADSINIVGECFLVITDKFETAEIGYYFHPDYWGNGFAVQTVNALLNFGFKYLELHRIIAKCDFENFGSKNILKKAGFRLEGQFKKESKIKGQWRDSLLYAMLENEWQKKINS
jgi:[ribosomal protein S5]-alanine N-acetyltransferase